MFQTKAIFQIPCATLMTLDTSIIQIDSYSKYLLVSTITRTFLCDTEKEQYRQIGKKLREGIFGACFAPIIEKPKSTNDQRIVCSRPGARLWQADFDATVTCTHHFKNIASQKPASIVHLEDVCDAHLSVTDYTTCDYELPETFNFGKVLGVARKFILTYTSDIVYIIDPHHATLLFWTNYYSGIQDIKVVNNYIYIQLENFHIETLFVSVLEDLILDTLFKKQYFFCAELCVHFAEDVLTLISTSNRIHLITILEEKLINARCNYLLDQIVPVLDKIREFSEAQFVARKLEGGVVTVENAYYAENKFYEQKSDTLQVLKELTEGSENIKEKLQCLEDKVKKAKIEEVIMEKKDTLDVQTTVKCTAPSETLCFTDTANNLKVLRKHYELNKINAQVETQRMKDLFGSKNVDSVVELLEGFVESSLVEITEREQVQAWCYTQFLKHLIRNEIPVDETIFNYTERAFVTLNVTKQFSCVCGYPLPQAKNKLPDFLIIGCKICQYLQERNKPLTGITNNVPYMWKYVITELNIAEFLPLILQLSDNDLFKAFYNKFTYDIWDEATNLLVKLKKAVCLNCDAKIETSGVITWSDFANLMLQSIGSISTAKLLKRYAKWIPNGDLDGSFYQTCIFSTALDNLQQDFRSEAVNFSTEMFSDKEMSLQVKLPYITVPPNHLIWFFLDERVDFQVSSQETYEANVLRQRCTACSERLQGIVWFLRAAIKYRNSGRCFYTEMQSYFS